MKRARKDLSRAFTLIEVLVVVAIVALLVSILIPSLSRAREQAKRTTCAANLHQVAFGLSSYSNDHRGLGPYRGHFSYTVAETRHEANIPPGGKDVKVYTNLGCLYKKWINSQQDALFCPSLYSTTRDLQPDFSNPSGVGGWKWALDPRVYWNYGGYNYAFPATAGKSPNLGGLNVFPQDIWSGDPTDTGVSTFWGWINTAWKSANPTAKVFRIPNNPCLATDWVIGSDGFVHLNGANAVYADGHVRYHLQSALDAGMTSGHGGQYEIFFRFSQKQ